MNKPRLSYSRSSVIISRPVLAVSLLLCVIAAFFGQTALAAALMFVFLLALAARVWAQLSARRLDFSIKSPAGGVFPGDEVDFELTAHNGKFMPLVWLELFAPVPQSSCMLPEDGRKPDEWECPTLEEEGASLDIVGEKRFSFIMWYDTVSASMRWRAERRGIFSMNTWRLRTGDGFGLAQVELELPERDVREIAVYPKLVDVIPDMFLRNLWNSESGSRGVMEDPTVIRSTRGYMTTDSLKHINWRLAARGQPLTVNVFEDIMPKSVHFIVDGDSFAGRTPNSDELEDTLSILASLAVRLERSQVRCGLSLPAGKTSPPVNLFAAEGAQTGDLLWAMAAYDLPELPAGLDRDSMTPEFNEPPVYDAANSAGRFYYVAYSSDSLTERTLLRALGGGITTVLTYTEPKPDGEFETACLRRLREVKADA